MTGILFSPPWLITAQAILTDHLIDHKNTLTQTNTMLRKAIAKFKQSFPAPEVHAHCDGPCGVYDPSAARINAEAVVAMTKKLLDLEVPDPSNKEATIAYNNTFSRFVTIKEEQAQLAKEEILILWTDYFKPQHLDKYPDLHDTFWKAAKLCSTCKVEVNLEHANELMEMVHKIHNMFWATKERDVSWYKAS